MVAKRWVGGVVGGVVVAGVLAGCSTPPAPPAAPGPTSGPQVRATPQVTEARPNRNSPAPEDKCPEGGVRLVETGGDAAMGLRVEGFQLVNCGTEPYVLEGYPEVSLRDSRNDPLEVTVEHGAEGITTGVPNIDAAPARVTLAPGQAASWSVVWRNLVTDATVTATTVPVLEIAPRPGAPRLWLRLARPFDLGNTGKLGIGPWTAATR
ncbi:DUF4232 domain-containing protein [Streptomyces sp. NPDC091204]|uniref:DUF4232 domain-containing protein n=1 Tax=Streptomyces sp. NPDC091204 TaxID=3155299 RepID=UPI003426D02C